MRWCGKKKGTRIQAFVLLEGNGGLTENEGRFDVWSMKRRKDNNMLDNGRLRGGDKRVDERRMLVFGYLKWSR